MSKKITLKHALADGTVATRQTARAYTHVVVGVFNTHRALANVEARREPRVDLIDRATYDWKHAQQIIKAGVGGKVFYHRNQGGAYLNRTGPQKTVRQFEVELAQKYHGGTLEQDIEKAIADDQAQHEASIARVMKVVPAATVLSWHGSHTLAVKASGGLQYGDYDVRIEEINNEVRA